MVDVVHCPSRQVVKDHDFTHWVVENLVNNVLTDKSGSTDHDELFVRNVHNEGSCLGVV